MRKIGYDSWFALVIVAAVLVVTLTVDLAPAPPLAPIGASSEEPGGVVSAIQASSGRIGPAWAYWMKADGEVKSTRSEVVRNLGLLLLGLIGLGFGIWRAYTAHRQAQAATTQAHTANEQARIAEQGNIADRFAKAAEMLSVVDNPRARTGAILALARVAQDSVDRNHIPVMEVLTEFIRTPPYQEAAKQRAEARGEADMPPPVQCPDIHAALQVIAERNAAQKERENKGYFKPSLTRAALWGLDLRGASLTEAELFDANLTGADLAHANLTNASLEFADLTSANLTSANLTGADLAYATLTNASLYRAHFTEAELSDANFTGADLKYADLTGADLTGANLDFAKGLTQEQIADCRPSASPINLPDDLDWPFVEKDDEWVRKQE